MGGWLTSVLLGLGARITGYALEPPSDPSFFEATGLQSRIDTSVLGDVRHPEALSAALREAEPSIVFHLAAQPLVRTANAQPHLTFETNIMGTVNLLEAVRTCSTVDAVLVVTTDKVYQNNNWHWAYRETDALGGSEPYSASKAGAELVLDAYRNVYFGSLREDESGTGLAAIRAGNIVGGGDWATDRLVPDIVRALAKGSPAVLRNPSATRPWQHVLDPLPGYLMLAEKLCADPAAYSTGWNFGPSSEDSVPVAQFAERLCDAWGGSASLEVVPDDRIFEENQLMLDSAKAAALLEWQPQWRLPVAIERTAEWYKAFYANEDVWRLTVDQCAELMDG